MVEGGCALRLALESLDESLILGVLLPQNLEGDIAVEVLVAGEIDFAHAPAAQKARDCVTVVYGYALHVH
jgi:uncharacterized protein (UPF0218 family)